MDNKKIFIAFAGEDIKTNQKILKLKHGCEFWNLKQFKLNDFIKAIKQKLQIHNRNFLYNGNQKDLFIDEAKFGFCSWGLLLPTLLQDSYINSYPETTSLIKLYSPEPIEPYFYMPDALKMINQITPHVYTDMQANFFKTSSFASFFKIMAPQSRFMNWQLNRSQLWETEDWRLYTACSLFNDLEKYEIQRNLFTWQRESADMCAILEMLFTAGENTYDEVKYRLIKRIAALLSYREITIEEDIKELYKQRSAFIHGSLFIKIAKETKSATNNMPLPEFKSLWVNKKHVRLALIAYLHISQLIKNDPSYFDGEKTVLAIIEKSIIDTNLRKKIHKKINKVLDLIPQITMH